MARYRYEGTRMFHLVTRTWNPIAIYPCYHQCVYCWSQKLIRRLRIEKYLSTGGKPVLVEKELRRRFDPGDFVFVGSMCDIFADIVPTYMIAAVLDHIRSFPKTTFLLLTKNPRRYWEFRDRLKDMDNVVAGATIETDNDDLYTRHRISRAPPPSKRIGWMHTISRVVPRTMVSIEPVLDFTNPRSFAEKIAEIQPEFVYIGYDNYNNRLPEPPLDKTLELVDVLRQHGITVYEKTIRRAWYET